MENGFERESGSRNVSESSDQHGEGASSPTSPRGRKRYQRHNPQQIQRLEGFFKECQHPDVDKKEQLSQELGLETKQITFWFQNKRNQVKALNEKVDIDLLRQENERLRGQNLALTEALKNATCSNCKRSPDQGEGSLFQLQKLELENEELRKKITNMAEDVNAGENGLQEIDEKTMMETAAKAMEEVIELLHTDEPLWTRCPNNPNNFMIHHENYKKRFPKANYLKSSSSFFESSKDSAEVDMNATDLVKLFMHPTDWVDLFPTIITKADTLRILDSQELGGSMHVMYEQMHIFSTLVAPREYAFLRYCIKCDPSSWVIVDVSYSCCTRMHQAPPTCYWKLPSGCKIQTLPNGNSKVTWVEHIEVDMRIQTRCSSGDLLYTAQAYGAKIWLANIQRTCQRFLHSSLRPPHRHDFGEVISIPEGRRSTMKLANKMVKNFCEMLTMMDKVNSPQPGGMSNSGVQVSIGQFADAEIISGAASFSLPLSCPTLFDFFTKEDMRPKWDVLFAGNHVNEVAHISCGHHPWNCISIIRPFVPSQQEPMLIFQESGIDSSGAYVIYSPMGLQTYTMAVGGQDTSQISLKPCGITISPDDDTRFHNCSTSVSPEPQHRSLVTVALQILIRHETLTDQDRIESAVKTMSTFLDSTIHMIKAALII